MSSTALAVLTGSLRDFRRTWPQLVVADLLARTLTVVIVAPAVGLLIKIFLLRETTRVVTDEAIVTFFLRPIGLTALVVVGAISLGILFIETGQLMVIGFGAAEDRRVSWLDAVVYASRRGVELVHLAGLAVVRLLLISAPFLAAVGGIYWLLVRTHDINYYLARKPPEFTAALFGAGALVVVLGVLIASKIATWLFALPMVLFEGMSGKRALQTSTRVTRPRRLKLTMWLIGWLLVTAVLSAAVNAMVGWLGGLMVSNDGSDITVLVIGLGAVVLVAGLAHLAVAVFTTTMFPLLVVRLYLCLAGPGELRPEIAAAGSLGNRAAFRVPGMFFFAGGLVALVVAVVGASVAVDEPDWEDPTQIIAHRGGASVAPENTIAAFERGIADGADWLELDVQENADGVVIVEHDRDFMRAAGARLPGRHFR